MTDGELTALLKAQAEQKYRDFTRRLTPTGYEILGVRIPTLRAIAKTVPAETEILLDSFEKMMVKGFVTAGRKVPFADYLDGIEAFLPSIDNWAVCDCFTSSLKPVAKHLDETYARFIGLQTGGEWERRFLAVLLLDYFLTDAYVERVLDCYRDMKQGEYYVDMAVAWGLSVALVKFYDQTVARLEKAEYSRSVTGKAIQKARDSYRITKEQKAFLTRYKQK